jgi:uncharacterized protein YcbK (DUF882 family)
MMQRKKQHQKKYSSLEGSDQLSNHDYGSNRDRISMLEMAYQSQKSNTSYINSLASILAENTNNALPAQSNILDFDILTSEEKYAATRYNNLRGYRKGSIKRYQRILNTSSDGIFGPKTAEAIGLFQMQKNLTIDGKLGPQTQRSLEEESPESSTSPPVTMDEDKETPLSLTETTSDGQLTQNFSLAEFESNDGAKTPSDIIPLLRELAEQLEVLKTAFGGAHISISSGYRSESHNHAVGGVTNSQHRLGRAADIKISGFAPSVVQDKIDHLMNTGKMKLGGLGRYSTFTHYDTRGHRAEWNG